ncbi:uncharacterized protein EAF01_009086 [Botrytis porri]|uniref:Mid2 domain-containing protein n=1 Tax=Botrytis porri TaxID=87229 RepID=A0A4Z1KJA9_9HELO|nr:uncharacterized protein EAF01_009086 [Botrytis porri]KAF7896683.1 hypothetical protein EAF01_009086 [Botrytis porri]TGO85570.1 hypothetical protein BPOR_0384g00090 [Botrytis porri]
MEFHVYKAFLFIFFFYLSAVRAQQAVDFGSIWVVPDGTQPDLSQTFRQGLTLQITWFGAPDNYQFDTLTNLWVTSWEYEKTAYSQLLEGNINANDSGTHDWTIDIPTSVLGKTAKYVLRFKSLNPAFNPDSRDVSSPAFLVITGDSASSSRTSTSSSTTSASAVSSSSSMITSVPTLSTSAVSSTQTSISATGAIASSTAADTIYRDKYTKLSGGLAAGIAVASVAILCAVLGLAYFLYKRRKNKRDPATQPLTEHPTGSLTKSPIYHEAPNQQAAVPSEKAAELGVEERPVELEG